jgi:predicted enzyme related to lactoylglutathione lyase
MKLLGLRTIIYPTDDLEADTAWWTDATGVAPYFIEPFYVGFEIGGYELGLLPSAPVFQGPVTYWGVEHVETAVAHFTERGCTVHHEPTDVGEGIITAELLSPRGHFIGLIYNPHFRCIAPEA